ncbi:hypothetical protein Csa_012525 [Cucumis sativus]|uniref:Uncharacterized protein n=1 Tax=Cucumis sativus TaxID=3659 RepID=A0A0A0L267_CUCSA|nr:hypothetical protein Csa_012525 [Cucumis sativus]
MFETLGFDLCFYVSLLGELSGEREERLHLTQALSLHALNWILKFGGNVVLTMNTGF